MDTTCAKSLEAIDMLPVTPTFLAMNHVTHFSSVASRSYLKCRTAVRIHKKLPCKCSVRKLLQFTCDTNV